VGSKVLPVSMREKNTLQEGVLEKFYLFWGLITYASGGHDEFLTNTLA